MEIDRVEQQRLETTVAHDVGNDAACEREQDARRFGEEEGLKLIVGDVAQKFNNDYASAEEPVFTLPEPIIPPDAARIMSLRDGSAKMSKSDPSDMSRINLTDDADTMMQKVKKAKTDPEPLPSEAAGLEGRPEARNLVGIYATLADTSTDAVLQQFGGQGFGAFKPALGELLVERLASINVRGTTASVVIGAKLVTASSPIATASPAAAASYLSR